MISKSDHTFHMSTDTPPEDVCPFIVPWSRDRLARTVEDVVEGSWQERDEYAARRPRDGCTMRRRIDRVLALRNGYFNTRNFVYGPDKETVWKHLDQACGGGGDDAKGVVTGFCRAIRRVKLDMYQLDDAAENIGGLTRLLEVSPLLSCVEFDGSQGEGVNLATRLATLLSGLARNPSGKVRSLKFEELYLTGEEGSLPVQNQIVNALSDITSLRVLEFYYCSMNLVRLVCRGLSGHAALAHVTIQSRYDAEDVAALLVSPPLPNLTTLQINAVSRPLLESLPSVVEDITTLSLAGMTHGDCDDVADILSRAHNVQTLELQGLPYQAQGIDTDVLGVGLCQLPSLDTLKVHGLIDADWIRQCCTINSHLQQLVNTINTRQRLPRGWLNAIIGENNDGGATLRSITLSQINSEETCHLLQLLESNTTLKSVRVEWLLQDTSNDLSEATVFQLRRTLRVNHSLKDMSLHFHPRVLPVLVEMIENNHGSLEFLSLDEAIDTNLTDFGERDVAGLFKALRKNKTLRGLTLHFAYRGTHLHDASWRYLLEAIRSNNHIELLDLSFPDPDDNGPVNVDDLGEALTHNFNLTTVKLRRNGRTQPQLDFVCRLFSRRNQIMKRIRQKEINDGLWPLLLESLSPNPSGLFLTMRYIQWPTSAVEDVRATA